VFPLINLYSLNSKGKELPTKLSYRLTDVYNREFDSDILDAHTAIADADAVARLLFFFDVSSWLIYKTDIKLEVEVANDKKTKKRKCIETIEIIPSENVLE